MKKFLAASLVVLSLNAFAVEVELTGTPQTSEYTYHTVTTCWYKGTSFEVEASEVGKVSVFTRKKTSEWWNKENFSYKLDGDKAIIALGSFNHVQQNNRACPKVVVQLVK